MSRVESLLHGSNYIQITSPTTMSLCNSHTRIIFSTAPTYAPHCHLGLVDRHRWSDGILARLTEKLYGGTRTGRSDSPIARVKGVGKQQHISCLVQHIGVHGGEYMYFGCFCFRGELGFLDCDDICVVNKNFELLKFFY